jgi:hypothetical protein
MNVQERFRDFEWLDVLVVGLLVAIAFAFVLGCMAVGGSAATADSIRTDPHGVSAILLRSVGLLTTPGLLIALCLMKGNLLGNPLALVAWAVAVNTLLYSVAFWLLLRFVRRFLSEKE